MKSKKFTAFLSWLLVIIPYSWLLAIVHHVDVARFTLILVILFLLIKQCRPYLYESMDFSPFQKKLLTLYLFLYPILIGLQHLIRIYTADHGIDIMYVLQPLKNFQDNLNLETSITDPQKINLLLHHFSPILYFLGIFTYMGVAPYIVISLASTVSIAFTLYLFYFFLRKLSYTSSLAIFITILLASNYNFRHSVEWIFKPEHLIYPFVVLAMYFWVFGKYKLSALSLLMTFTAKETFFLFGLGFCFMVAVDALWKRKKYSFSAILSYSLVFVIGIIGFFMYFLFKAEWTGLGIEEAYNSPHKLIATWDDLQEISFWVDPLYWLFLLFLPVLALPLWFPKSWHKMLAIAPAIGIILLNKTQSMLGHLGYYTAFPTLYIFLISAMCLKEYKAHLQKAFPIVLALVLMALSHFFGGWKPSKIIAKNIIKGDYFNTEVFSFIPKGAKVLVTSHSIGYFNEIPNRFHLIFSHHIKENLPSYQKTLKELKYLIIEDSKESIKQFPESLRKKLILLHKDEKLSIYSIQ